MRIACLQYNPQLGTVEANIARVNELLDDYKEDVVDLDLLVLPELALTGMQTGYNFPSLTAITPHLEPTVSSLTTAWAKATAARLKCLVSVGYPEQTNEPAPPLTPLNASTTANYNSTVTVSPAGDVLAHYRKTHLYYTDETWAHESPTGWLTTDLPLPAHPLMVVVDHASGTLSSVPDPGSASAYASTSTVGPSTSTTTSAPGVKTAFGICMDLNPHRFASPWSAYEFSSRALATCATLLILSMAWTTSVPADAELWSPSLRHEPDMDTLGYWIERLRPVIGADDGVERLVVIANRTGREGDVGYVGSSVVMGVGGWVVKIWGILGRGEEKVLVIDTEEEAKWRVRLKAREEEGFNNDED
ncbi:MAG: Carbon-nitrogen hydrolase [Icmadophila ericetorum]|nr:Carbon-nitrogen hydrolase [Icmadophila ericetorum]